MARIYFLVPAMMSLIALFQLPYGYYQLLKLVVTLMAGVIAYSFWQLRSHGWALAFTIAVLIYNPVIPLHLGRSVWQWMNVATAMLFLHALGLIEYRERVAAAKSEASLRSPGR